MLCIRRLVVGVFRILSSYEASKPTVKSAGPIALYRSIEQRPNHRVGVQLIVDLNGGRCCAAVRSDKVSSHSFCRQHPNLTAVLRQSS